MTGVDVKRTLRIAAVHVAAERIPVIRRPGATARAGQ
jgi:hypothetical protein